MQVQAGESWLKASDHWDRARALLEQDDLEILCREIGVELSKLSLDKRHMLLQAKAEVMVARTMLAKNATTQELYAGAQERFEAVARKVKGE